MAIVGNVASEIGDIIRITTDVPVIGIVSLQSFMDDVLDETGERYFEKSFRYSIDGGLNFTIWYDLNTVNIQNIEISRKNQFVIDYRYVRSGEEESGTLAFNNLTLSGDFQELPYPVYRRNVFNQFYDVNDVGVLGWALNVLEKLYNRGILPDYITRKWDEDNPLFDDVDFTAFFNTITHFFAIIVYMGREYEDIYSDEILLPYFLESIGLFLEINQTFLQQQVLMGQYPSEFKARGTESVVYFDNLIAGTPAGELLRLISYQYPEDQLLALLEPHATGWCVSKSSPTFNYTTHCANMVKGYETSEGITDQNNYPTQGSVITIVDNTMRLQVTTGLVGIYTETFPTKPNASYLDNAIVVSEELDYEIVIRIKDDNVGVPPDHWYFGVRCFDADENEVVPFNLTSKTNSSFFFEAKRLHSINKEYMIRGILYSSTTSDNFGDTRDMKLNIGYGSYLKMSPTTRFIAPMIYLDNGFGGGTIIECKARPLNFNFTLGKFGLKHILYFLYKNNSTLNTQGIYNKASQYLIPYNNTLIDRDYKVYDTVTRNLTNFGYMYNDEVVASGEIAPLGWRVPSPFDVNTLLGELGDNTVANNKLKEIGLSFWDQNNTEATNESGFTALGGGWRWRDGAFKLWRSYTYFWTLDDFTNPIENIFGYLQLSSEEDDAMQGLQNNNVGQYIRLIKESSIDDGFVLDQDGNEIPTVTIGNQVWTAQNWKSTKLNNGTPIPNITDPDEWSDTTTIGRCAFDNNENYV